MLILFYKVQTPPKKTYNDHIQICERKKSTYEKLIVKMSNIQFDRRKKKKLINKYRKAKKFALNKLISWVCINRSITCYTWKNITNYFLHKLCSCHAKTISFMKKKKCSKWNILSFYSSVYEKFKWDRNTSSYLLQIWMCWNICWICYSIIFANVMKKKRDFAVRHHQKCCHFVIIVHC